MKGEFIIEIIIKKLTNNLVYEYLNFFDTTEHHVDGYKCYCVGWSNMRYEERDLRIEINRREAAQEYIKKNAIQGYLAYYNNEIIAWCNANTKADCFESEYGKMYLEGYVKKETEKVKSIFCFVVNPKMRKKGIAKKLLEHVIDEAKKEGFSIIEAYPNKEVSTEVFEYMGYKKMYEDFGFEYAYDMDFKVVMRKKLV